MSAPPPTRTTAPDADGHGYGRYSRGCRCGTCKAAKAEYMRRRRRAGRAAVDPSRTTIVEGITHGRYGYEERGCRCGTCLSERSASDFRTRRNRSARHSSRHPDPSD